MNKRDTLEVAVKVLGLYCLLSFLGSIMFVGMALSSADSKYIENKALYLTFSCLATLLYLAFAVAFLPGGRRIAEMLMRDSGADRDGARAAQPPYAQLHFWVRLLGLYFFVSVIGRVVSDIAQAAITVRSIFWWSKLGGEILQLGLSLAFIFRSDRVAKLVEGVAKPTGGAQAG